MARIQFDLEEVVTTLLSNESSRKASGNDTYTKSLVVHERTKENGFESKNKSRLKPRSEEDVECYYYHMKGILR